MGEEIGRGLGFVIGKIAEKVSESLGEKFPEVEGDKTAAAYLDKSKKKLHHIIHSEAQHIPDHHASVNDLHALIHFLRSEAASKEAIKKFVNKKLSEYQNSVELMYENPKQLILSMMSWSRARRCWATSPIRRAATYFTSPSSRAPGTPCSANHRSRPGPC